jgi:MFS family permease
VKNNWLQFDPNVRKYLINAGLYGITVDGGIATVIFNLYLLRLGLSPEVVGTVNAVGMFAFALTSLPMGRIGERWSLRRTMLLGMIISVVGMAMVPMAELLPKAQQVLWLIIANIIVNAGLAGHFVNGAPYIVALTQPAKRANVFSIQSAIYAISGFVGSIIGGVMPQRFAELTGVPLTQPEPYRWTLALIPFILLAPIALVWSMREIDSRYEVAPAANASSTAIPNTVALAGMSMTVLFVMFGVVRFFMVGGLAVAQTFFNVYMDSELQVTTSTIGTIQAIAKLLGVPAALALPLLTHRFGSVRSVIVASTVVTLGLLPIAWVPVWWAAGLGYIAMWLATPVRYAAFMVYSMERTPSHLRGSMNGAQEMVAGLSFALIGFVGGYIITALGYAALFTLGALFTLLGVVVFTAYAQRSSRRAHRAAHAQPTEPKTQ